MSTNNISFYEEINSFRLSLIRKVPHTTIAEFANTVDPDETAHNQDLQCLHSSLRFINIIQFILKVFKFYRHNFVVCFL